MVESSVPHTSEAYRNKIILAPMVRAGTLPFRLLALDYGADLVYTEEVIDYKIVNARRVVNERLGTVDFCVDGDDTPVFQTCEREKSQVVFQMGTNDPERALKVAQLVQDDIFAIDVNMGCPKPFSIKGGMGAALLKCPDHACNILRRIVNGVRVPVTCKIRVLDTEEATLQLCRQLAATGVSAIAIHGRQRDERPRDSNRNRHIAYVCERMHLPIIANGGSGEVKCYSDIARFKQETGCSSVMIARAALKNTSVFRNEATLLDKRTVIRQYLKYCAQYDIRLENAKYVVQRICEGEQQTTDEGRLTLAAIVPKDLYVAWNISFDENKITQPAPATHKRPHSDDNEDSESGPDAKKSTSNGIVQDGDVYLLDLIIPPKRLKHQLQSPKSVLHQYCVDRNIRTPVYTCAEPLKYGDRRYNATVTVCGKQYSVVKNHASKRLAEQAAALSALYGLDVRNLLTGEWEEHVPNMG